MEMAWPSMPDEPITTIFILSRAGPTEALGGDAQHVSGGVETRRGEHDVGPM